MTEQFEYPDWYDETPDETIAQLRAALAQPREFARRYDNVLAQLEQAKKEIDACHNIMAEVRGLTSQPNGLTVVAVREELDALRAANDELQAEIKELHERSAAENSEITNCLKNIAELVTQRRGLEVDLSDARAALAQAQAERDAALEQARELQVAITTLNNLCNMTAARADRAEAKIATMAQILDGIDADARAAITAQDTDASEMVVCEAVAETCRRIRAALAGTGE